MKTASEKIKAAVEIFKAQFPGVHGKFRFYVSETNSNEVEVFTKAGLDSYVNLLSRKVRLV